MYDFHSDYKKYFDIQLANARNYVLPFVNELKPIVSGMKLQPVIAEQGEHLQQLLEYYMGKNTPQRQDFIIDNLRVELDMLVEGAPNP